MQATTTALNWLKEFWRGTNNQLGYWVREPGTGKPQPQQSMLSVCLGIGYLMESTGALRATPHRVEVRVGICPQELTADEGILFLLEVIEMVDLRAQWSIGVEDELPKGCASGMATLGSDARLAWIESLAPCCWSPRRRCWNLFG